MAENVLFQGSKTFWRQRATLDILIVEHASVDHTSDSVEVISYDPTLNMEAPRMYLKTRQLVDCISAQEIASRVAQEKEIILRKHDHPNEEEIEQKVMKELLIKYLESKIMIADYSIEDERLVMSLLPSFDNSKTIDIAVAPPEHIAPYTTQHYRQLHDFEIISAVTQLDEEQEKILRLCEEASNFENRARIHARWKLPLIALRLKNTRARSDGPLPAIDDSFVQENTAFSANSEDAANFLERQQEAAERALAEGKAVHSSHIGGLELREASYEHQMKIDHLDQQTAEKKLEVLDAIRKHNSDVDANKEVDTTSITTTSTDNAAAVKLERSPDSHFKETEAAARRRNEIMKAYGRRPRTSPAVSPRASSNSSPALPPLIRGKSKTSTHSRSSHMKKKLKRSELDGSEDSDEHDGGVPMNWEDDCCDAALGSSKKAKLKHQPMTQLQHESDGGIAHSMQEMVHSILRWGVDKVSGAPHCHHNAQQILVAADVDTAAAVCGVADVVAMSTEEDGSVKARIRDKPAASVSTLRKGNVTRNTRSSHLKKNKSSTSLHSRNSRVNSSTTLKSKGSYHIQQ